MKAYRVNKGTGTNHYGYSNNTEAAEYFFNREDAEKRQMDGGFYIYEGVKYWEWKLEEIEIN